MILLWDEQQYMSFACSTFITAYWYLIPTGPILNSGPAASCNTGKLFRDGGRKKKKKKLKLHLSLSLKQKRSPRLDSSPAKHVTHHRHLPLSPAPHLSVGQIINIWRETDKVFHRSAQLRANLLWCALNYSGTFSNKTLASQKQCHNGAFGTLAPMSCSETLEHLEDPSVINWQPGLEKMSDLSDVQTCGLLNSGAVRLW